MASKCYVCGKIRQLYKPKNKKNLKWKRTVKGKNGFLWLCPECAKNKCKICGILLSNTLICKKCGKKHGAFYEYSPSLCKKCYDKIIKQKNEKKSC